MEYAGSVGVILANLDSFITGQYIESLFLGLTNSNTKLLSCPKSGRWRSVNAKFGVI